LNSKLIYKSILHTVPVLKTELPTVQAGENSTENKAL